MTHRAQTRTTRSQTRAQLWLRRAGPTLTNQAGRFGIKRVQTSERSGDAFVSATLCHTDTGMVVAVTATVEAEQSPTSDLFILLVAYGWTCESGWTRSIAEAAFLWMSAREDGHF